ncbi:MAG: O-antigen ligase family protein [Ignavibacteriae bacterium]|nr:O-antigen ligase family protein [Ignavibacteria bacterium]MBI3364984.1 O-antigen ligase family protein [Ignavibacteriota bacterium]
MLTSPTLQESAAPLDQASSPAKRKLNAGQYILLAIFVGTSLLVSLDINDSTLLKEAALFLGSLLLVAAAFSHALRRGRICFSILPLHIAFILYILVCSLSLFFAVNASLGLAYLLQLLCFFIIFSTSLTVPPENRGVNTKIAQSFASVTLIACVVALFQIMPNVRFGILPVSMVQEAVSTFGNRSYFAGFLALVVPIVLSRAVSRESTRMIQALFLITTLITLFFLLQTESRSAWMATLASVFLFTWMNYRKTKPRLIMLALMLLGGVCGVFFFPELVHRRLTSLIEMYPSSSVNRRLFFYEGAWKAFLASPIVGHGPGNFGVVLPKYRSPDYWMAHSEDIVPHAHNEVLEILTETGLVGFFCMALIAVIYIRSIRTVLRASSGNNRTILVGYTCAVFAVFIDNIASMNLRTIPVAVSFWIVVGLSLQNSARTANSITLQFPRWSRKFWLAPFVLVLLVMWAYQPKLVSHYKAEEAFLQGIILRAANRTSESTQELNTTLAYDPTNAMAQLYVASNLVREKHFAEARNHVTFLLKEYPYYPKARIVLATALFGLGDTLTAIQTIHDELAMDTSPQATYFAAYLAHQSNRAAEELQSLRLLLTNALKSGTVEYVPEALRGLSQLCGEKEKNDCRALVSRVSDKFFTDVRVLSAAGGFFATVGSLDEARSALQRAQILDPANEEIERNLQIIEDQMGRDTSVHKR